jgi:hypothetical protein
MTHYPILEKLNCYLLAIDEPLLLVLTFFASSGTAFVGCPAESRYYSDLLH